MTVRELEAQSIRAFVASHRFEGRVLDYGCGKRPYSDLVERTAEYAGYDRVVFPANVSLADIGFGSGLWDAILCTQVIQYAPRPLQVLDTFRAMLVPGGALVMTYPTNWDEVEPEDLWRFTKHGMERLLDMAGFAIERHERRAAVVAEGMSFPLGYGVVART